MKILLIAGNEYEFVSQCLSSNRKTVIANKNTVMLSGAPDYLKDNPVPVDAILVTDGGLSANPIENLHQLEQLLESTNVNITIITRDYLFNSLNQRIRVVISPWFRALEKEIQIVFDDTKQETSRFIASQSKKPLETKTKVVREEKVDKQTPTEKKIPRWRLSKSKSKDEDKREIGGASMASSKAVVFTGRRSSGVTGTAVNAAWCACRRGINTVLVDFDTDYRSINLYFGKFYKEADEDDEISTSLIRVLAQPQSYKTTAVMIETGLWVTSLGYGFSDDRLLAQHFTESKMIGMITSLKHSFDLVVVDFPLDLFAQAPDLLNSVDVVALCMENSIYSAITTLRSIVLGFGDRELIAYIASKAKLIVSKYNDESTYGDEIITPERLSELIVSEGFCEDFKTELTVAGSVPYVSWFGKQIESDIPAIDMDSRMKQAYDSMLLRLLGAVR